MRCDIFNVLKSPFIHMHKSEWNRAKRVELKDAIPSYNYTTDEEWDGWEAREILFQCADAIEGPDTLTAVFELDGSVSVCAKVFIFVS